MAGDLRIRKLTCGYRGRAGTRKGTVPGREGVAGDLPGGDAEVVLSMSLMSGLSCRRVVDVSYWAALRRVRIGGQLGCFG